MHESEQRVEELEERLAKLENFASVSARGQEQLWKVVFEDVLKQPVPAGEDLRDLI
jgi:hypothetical protein